MELAVATEFLALDKTQFIAIESDRILESKNGPSDRILAEISAETNYNNKFISATYRLFLTSEVSLDGEFEAVLKARVSRWGKECAVEAVEQSNFDFEEEEDRENFIRAFQYSEPAHGDWMFFQNELRELFECDKQEYELFVSKDTPYYRLREAFSTGYQKEIEATVDELQAR